jgi:hypothetical protein
MGSDKNFMKDYERSHPPENQANFYNIGNEVLRNHLMAGINYTNENDYMALAKQIIKKIFFCSVDDELVNQLNSIVSEYFSRLKSWSIELLEVV